MVMTGAGRARWIRYTIARSMLGFWSQKSSMVWGHRGEAPGRLKEVLGPPGASQPPSIDDLLVYRQDAQCVPVAISLW